MPVRTAKGEMLQGDQVARWLLDATSDYAVLMDSEGTVHAANQRLATRLGVSMDDLVGSNLFKHFDDDQAARYRSVADMVLRHKAPIRYQDVSRSGKIYDNRIQPIMDDDGEVIRLAVFVSDVSEYMHAERERILLGSAMQQAAEVVVIFDTNFNINYVNQAFEEMSGYSLKDAKGMNLEVLYVGRRQREVLQRISRAMQRGDVWVGRTNNTRKDGKVFTCEKTVSPIRGRYGMVQAYVSIWRDVTREAELERQLRHAQKMEAIGTLAGGIAHDFNNILGPIILHSELGLSSLGQDDPARSYFHQILDAADRARQLVDQILRLSRQRESDEVIPFRLTLLLKECLKLLRPTLPATIAIDTDLATEHDYIMADPTEVHQLIMNLATNASQAMAAGGGRLIFSVSLEDCPDGVSGIMTEAEPGRYVHLSVSDTGCGMNADVLEHIFDPFFTTKGEGTGLGLTVVHNIVSRLCGAIRVDSVRGRGTTFHVHIPPSPQEPSGDRPSSCCRGETKGRERILIVDDDRAIRESCTIILTDMGYRVDACANGREALMLLKQTPGDFDLVLSNILMPEINGFDLAAELQLLRPRLPVLLFTGDPGLAKAARTRNPSVKDCLLKPFRRDELALAVRRALDCEKHAGHKVKTP